ncbi:helix-turn-helix transcriptional regulator [Pseudomonas sp. CK-NBRI-02]|nr:helix-turn-helix transcriptional regulator [Pseudomonas sp. CK-NBRI-02]TYO83753.1 helix-turn-helix transcriptional regulator [Pseudomonas sp. CK-NBRI-02]
MRDAGYIGHGSATRLSRELRVTPKAVAKWLHGESMPTFQRVAEIARVLRADPEWLLWGNNTDATRREVNGDIELVVRDRETVVLSENGDGVTLREMSAYDHPDLIPISSWDDETPVDDDEVEVPFLREVELSAGSGRTVIEESSKAKLRFGKMTLRKHSVQFDQAVCVPVHGNSMEPVLPHGSTVAINKAATSVVDGKMYALSHAGHLRVKTLYRLPGGGIRLRSFNREEHPDEEYTAEQMRENEISILGRVFWSAAFH